MAARPVEAGKADAPEIDQAVHRARDKLLALARVAQVTEDPAGPMLEALAAQLDAEHRLFDDLKRTLVEVKRPEAVFTDKQVDDVGRRLLGACQAWSAGLVRASSWSALAAIVLAALVLGFGAGWLYRGDLPTIAGLSAGANKCEDRPDGSRLCWIPVWERLPPSPAGK